MRRLPPRLLPWVAAIAAGCGSPTGPLDNQPFVLVKIDGSPLPAQFMGINRFVVADTLVFGARSPWTGDRLARSNRWSRSGDADAPVLDQWWYRYGSTDEAEFSMEGACVDPRNFSCLAYGGIASLKGDVLTIRFTTRGVLEYRRVR